VHADRAELLLVLQLIGPDARARLATGIRRTCGASGGVALERRPGLLGW
jgi:hypothetical protein